MAGDKRGELNQRPKTGTVLRSAAEKLLFPVFLALWPLVSIHQGVNAADTTYSLANYLYLTPEYPWFFATFLANRVGSLLMRLSPGGSMAVMNLLTGLLISATALACYSVLGRRMPKWLVFLGEVIAISLCWCPTVILYNYLTYVLLTAGVLLLYAAVQREAGNPLTGGTAPAAAENGVTAAKNGSSAALLYFLAGICLGLNVTVRIANVTQAALILAVWWFYFRSEQIFVVKIAGGNGRVRRALWATLWCIGGYAAGLALVLMISAIFYGPAAYFEAIPGILAMTSGSEGYGLSTMLRDIMSAYFAAGKWFVLLAAGAAAGGIFLFAVERAAHSGDGRIALENEAVNGTGRTGSGRSLIHRAAVVLYLAAIALLIRLLYGRGMFTVNYQDYWCMFQWAMVLVLLSWIMAVIGAAGATEQFLGAAVVIQLLILPLGSNNYTFPILNCLFIIAPYTLTRLYGMFCDLRTACKWMIAAVLVMVLVQGSMFHIRFAFGDGTDGTARTAVMTDGVLRGMHTTEENAAELTGLISFLQADRTKEPGEEDHPLTAICFGNIPGIHYIAQVEPALSTTWPDLDSYPAAWMEEELMQVSTGRRGAGLPMIILSDRAGEAGYASEEEKLFMLQDYMSARHYEEKYRGPGYTVYCPPGSSSQSHEN